MNIGKHKSTRLDFVQGDIVTSGLDAIVNAANSEMRGGSGVDGAIHSAAGSLLLTAEAQWVMSERYGTLVPVGCSIITPSFGLVKVGTKYIIHTVGPNEWDHSPSEFVPMLENCFITSLGLAREQGDVSSIAFPLISTGIFGVPMMYFAQAARNVFMQYDFGNVKKVSLYIFRDLEAERVLRSVIH